MTPGRTRRRRHRSRSRTPPATRPPTRRRKGCPGCPRTIRGGRRGSARTHRPQGPTQVPIEAHSGQVGSRNPKEDPAFGMGPSASQAKGGAPCERRSLRQAGHAPPVAIGAGAPDLVPAHHRPERGPSLRGKGPYLASGQFVWCGRRHRAAGGGCGGAGVTGGREAKEAGLRTGQYRGHNRTLGRRHLNSSWRARLSVGLAAGGVRKAARRAFGRPRRVWVNNISAPSPRRWAGVTYASGS